VTNILDAEAQALTAEQIADDIEALENTKAPLWAVYGPGGTYEAERKNLWCMCAVDVRSDAQQAGTKMSEAAIEQAAHVSTAYRDFLNSAEDDRTQLALLEAQINKKVRLYELAQGRMNTARKLIRFDGNNGA
jgi:hypothetical protein